MDPSSLTGDALVEAHKSVGRRLRLISVAFPVLFISLIVANLFAIAGLIRDIDASAVGSLLTRRANALLPELHQSLGELADAVQPVLSQSLETEALAMAPQIEQRLQKDVEHTVSTARAELQIAVGKSMASSAQAQRDLLAREFPLLAGDTEGQDRVLAAAREALTQWERKQLDATIGEHMVAMEQLQATLQSSYSKPTSQPADPEDALMTWLNLMNEHVGGEGKILAKDEKPGKAARAPQHAGKP